MHSNYTKMELRRIVNKACKDRDIKDIREGMEGMTKLEELKLGDYEAKPYLKLKSLGQVREIFRSRTNMVEGFRANYKNRYNGMSLNCPGCQETYDSQSHAMVCTAYEDLRDGLDMAKDLDLVQFFKRVMERRDV